MQPRSIKFSLVLLHLLHILTKYGKSSPPPFLLYLISYTVVWLKKCLLFFEAAQSHERINTKGGAMNRKLLSGLAVGVVTFGMSTSSMASVIVLDFEGIPSDTAIGNYYNGAGGPNYGITFSGNSLALSAGNYDNNPTPPNILYYLSGGAATMNVASGFNTGFSFYYAASQGGTVNVYDGLNATGNVLASVNLSATPSPYYVWEKTGVSFNGTARSVDFGGTADLVGFDNITLGSAIASPGSPAPEPASMILIGTGIAGMAALRRKKKQQSETV